ncbi:cytochrome c biogenesis CcdA family protein [Aquipuribacter hungaricus]|uniref:Cytochrome c biogenesis CcdA family protein n=1 Tax=Aquipuribacter hungaricus TaxID=545624 RepID=A0ABV7WHD0_9MICO
MTSVLQDTVLSGSMLLAVPVAVLAGLVSFLSPCVLPLVPGYLSYVTGLSGADLDEPRPGRVVAGTALFVAGFAAVFASFGALFGGLGSLLLQYQSPITRVMGVVIVVMGLAFLGYVPGLQRERRFHLRPARGLVGAPLLGVTFGLGWTPCIGPALAAVQTLAFTEASAGRGTLLSVAYALGLGVPFLAVGLAVRRTAGALGWVRRHRVAVTRAGGGLLVLTGLLLATGVWERIMVTMRIWAAAFTPVI